MNYRFPKSTVEAKVWCQKCRRPTMHRIDNGLVGACRECMIAPAPPARPVKKPKPVQLSFDENKVIDL